MAISNNTTGLRPGVCTSTTRPTAPYNGQVIYETDTKQTLVWQGSAWVMLTDADTPPGMQLVASGALSGTTVTVTDCFTGFTNYRIMAEGITASAGEMYIKLRNSGGVSSTGYDWGLYGIALNGGAVSYGAANNPYIPCGGYNASVTMIDIFRPNEAVSTRFMAQHTLDVSGTYYFRNYGGEHTPATAYPSIEWQAGSAMTGKYWIYGYRD